MGEVHEMPPVCNIRIDDTLVESNDFIAVLYTEEGPELYYNTDALTVGLAVKLLMQELVELLRNCSTEELLEVSKELGMDFLQEAVRTDE
jgi:hypothetical protein